MIRTLLTLLSFVCMPSVAVQAHNEPLSVQAILCKGDRQKALEAMHRRQHLTPYDLAMKTAEGDPILTAFTMMAYQRPIRLTQAGKMKVINVFSNKFYAVCLQVGHYDG